MSTSELLGIQPAVRKYLDGITSFVSGDIVLSCSPATLGSSAAAVNAAIGSAAAKHQRTVVIYVKNTAGNTLTCFDGTFAIAASKVSTSGTIAIDGEASTATFVNGVATVTLNYAGTWAEGDTATLTVTGSTKLGYTVANKTSVDTLVA